MIRIFTKFSTKYIFNKLKINNKVIFIYIDDDNFIIKSSYKKEIEKYFYCIKKIELFNQNLFNELNKQKKSYSTFLIFNLNFNIYKINVNNFIKILKNYFINSQISEIIINDLNKIKFQITTNFELNIEDILIYKFIIKNQLNELLYEIKQTINSKKFELKNYNILRFYNSISKKISIFLDINEFNFIKTACLIRCKLFKILNISFIEFYNIFFEKKIDNNILNIFYFSEKIISIVIAKKHNIKISGATDFIGCKQIINEFLIVIKNYNFLKIKIFCLIIKTILIFYGFSCLDNTILDDRILNLYSKNIFLLSKNDFKKLKILEKIYFYINIKFLKEETLLKISRIHNLLKKIKSIGNDNFFIEEYCLIDKIENFEQLDIFLNKYIEIIDKYNFKSFNNETIKKFIFIFNNVFLFLKNNNVNIYT